MGKRTNREYIISYDGEIITPEPIAVGHLGDYNVLLFIDRCIDNKVNLKRSEFFKKLIEKDFTKGIPFASKKEIQESLEWLENDRGYIRVEHINGLTFYKIDYKKVKEECDENVIREKYYKEEIKREFERLFGS